MLRLLLSFLVAAIASVGSASGGALAPQTSSEQGVGITVAPQDMSTAATSWDFEVILQTHIHPLTEDLTKSSELIAEGKRYLPLEWVGTPPGGHHRKGVLRFRPIVPQPRSMELQIRLNGEATPRSFTWALNGK